MDSWRHVNYNTFNSTLRMEYFNMSTADWDIGFLPPNVVAVQELLDAYPSTLPRGALVIENAGKTRIGTSKIEAAVYGIASGAVIIWCVASILITRYGILKSKKAGPSDLAVEADEEQPLNLDSETNPYNILGFMSAQEFQNRLNNRYYEPVDTEVELVEKSPLEMQECNPADVEAMAALLREMYRKDMRLNGLQNASNVEHQREDLRTASEAAWGEVTGNIEMWTKSLNKFNTEEQASWSGILNAIVEAGDRRYPPRVSHNGRFW